VRSECSWEAIFDAPSVPEVFSADTALNALTTELPGDFKVQGHQNNSAPTSEGSRGQQGQSCVFLDV